jgi:hypothetical protein
MKLYSTKSNAIRGAKRLKIENPDIRSDADGKFFIADAEPDTEESVTLPQGVAEEVAPEPVVAPTSELKMPDPVFKRPEKTDAYRQARNASPEKSEVANPVLVCKLFFEKNPNMPKHAAIQALVFAGVNFNTAKTQYAHYFGRAS